MTQPLDPGGAGATGHLSPARPHGMFASFRFPPFLRLWLGSSVVFLGVMGQSIARSWLAFDLKGTNAALGGVLLSFGLAMVIATPFGGVVGDRLPKRAVILAAIALLGVTSAWIGLAVAFDVIAYWMLLVAGALQAVAFAVYNPARMAFVTELVPSRNVPEAVTLLLINAEASRVAGPALAGVAITSISYGVQAVFLTCAVLFAGGFVAGLGLPHGRPKGSASDRSPFGDLLDGLRYVSARPPLMKLLLCIFGVVMIGLPYLAFLPAVSDGLFDVGSAGYGALSASSAVGAVAAGLFVGILRRRLGPWRLIVAAGGVFGLAILGLGAAPSFLLALVVLVPLGAALMVFQTSSQALLMSLSDLTYHGRIQGLVMLSFGGFGVIALPLGLVADAIGLRETFAGMGVVVVATVAVFAMVSRRHWGQSRLLDVG
jgi:MFS family permease